MNLIFAVFMVAACIFDISLTVCCKLEVPEEAVENQNTVWVSYVRFLRSLNWFLEAFKLYFGEVGS